MSRKNKKAGNDPTIAESIRKIRFRLSDYLGCCGFNDGEERNTADQFREMAVECLNTSFSVNIGNDQVRFEAEAYNSETHHNPCRIRIRKFTKLEKNVMRKRDRKVKVEDLNYIVMDERGWKSKVNKHHRNLSAAIVAASVVFANKVKKAGPVEVVCD